MDKQEQRRIAKYWSVTLSYGRASRPNEREEITAKEREAYMKASKTLDDYTNGRKTSLILPDLSYFEERFIASNMELIEGTYNFINNENKEQ